MSEKAREKIFQIFTLLLAAIFGAACTLGIQYINKKYLVIDVSFYPSSYWGYMTDGRNIKNSPYVINSKTSFYVDTAVSNRSDVTIGYYYTIDLLEYQSLDVSHHTFTSEGAYHNYPDHIYLYNSVSPNSKEIELWELDREPYLSKHSFEFLNKPPISLQVAPSELNNESILLYFKTPGIYKIRINMILQSTASSKKTKTFKIICVDSYEKLPLE